MHYTMDNSDKPFKCPKCELCFTNSDRLNVHLISHIKHTSKSRLKVKIPGSLSENTDDQTPTPSSFLKTADVNGSPLFQDLNPFDQDFKIASNSRQISTVEQNSEVGSSTDIKQHTVLETPKVELEEAVFPRSYINNLDQQNTYDINKDVIRSVSVIASTDDEQAAQDENDSSDKTSSVSSTSVDSNQNTAALLQSILNQLKTQTEHTETKQQTHETEIAQVQQPDIPNITKENDAVPSVQDSLREQLRTLIKAGQIKLQITSYPTSTKVQASIVGNVAIAKSRDSASSQQTSIAPRSIAPKTINVVKSSPIPSVNNLNPITVSATSSTTAVSDIVVLPGTNLQIAKQKLKQTIQQAPESTPQQIISEFSPFTGLKSQVVNGTPNLLTSASRSGGGSSQGKYKDIILKDEFGEDIMLKRKGRTTSEDSTPEEKRRKFLERNRAAASRCRQKRKIWVNQLEKKSDNLASTNAQLTAEITALRSEVAQLKALLLAHKDCPVTQQQKALVNQIANAGTYVAVSDGQLIAIHQLPASAIREASDEEVASSALTDMAARATIEIGKKSASGMITVQADDNTMTKLL